MNYIIRNVNDPTLFWSSDYGWVDSRNCDEFSEVEKSTFNLPIEGEWLKVIDRGLETE